MSSGPAYKCDVCGKMESAVVNAAITTTQIMRPPGMQLPLPSSFLPPIGWFGIDRQVNMHTSPVKHACGEDCAQMLITNLVLEEKA